MKLISLIITLLLTTTLAYGELIEQTKLKHGVSELGNLQVYYVTEIIEDDKVISSNKSIAYTPSDITNMDDWDDKSKELAQVITNKKVKEDFNAEKQIMTGIGLEKIITYDRTIENLGAISVRRVTRVFKNGKEISKKYHRGWIMPGANPDNADVISKAISKKIHTPECIAKYKAEKAKRELIHQ